MALQGGMRACEKKQEEDERELSNNEYIRKENLQNKHIFPTWMSSSAIVPQVR